VSRLIVSKIYPDNNMMSWWIELSNAHACIDTDHKADCDCCETASQTAAARTSSSIAGTGDFAGDLGDGLFFPLAIAADAAAYDDDRLG